MGYALNDQPTKFLRPWFSQNRRQNLGTGAAEKLLPIRDFHDIVIRSHITLYIGDIGIDVIIISVAQQQKPRFSREKFSPNQQI